MFLMRNKNIILRECFSTELGLDFEVVSRNIKMLEKALFLQYNYLEGYIGKLTEDVRLQQSL